MHLCNVLYPKSEEGFRTLETGGCKLPCNRVLGMKLGSSVRAATHALNPAAIVLGPFFLKKFACLSQSVRGCWPWLAWSLLSKQSWL